MFSTRKVDILSESLRAIRHPLRIKMMAFINVNEEVNVKQIYKHFSLEQSAASRHLRLLRECGLVRTKQNGKYVFYSLDKDRIDRINQNIETFLSTLPDNGNGLADQRQTNNGMPDRSHSI